MDNATKLVEQIRTARPGLRVADIFHEKDCKQNPCQCQTRAIVVIRERANNRAGFIDRRYIVRLRDDAPEPMPFTMPDSANQEPSEPEKKREPFIKWENS